LKPKTGRKIKRQPKLHPLHPQVVMKKGGKFVTALIHATGIPTGYASTIAWFAERLILAAICIAVAAFASGVLFTLYLAPPIATSPAYNVLANGAAHVREQVIDLTSPIFLTLIGQNRAENLAKEQLALRRAKLKIYLQSKSSPFANDDKTLDALANAKNMKLIVAISFVESTFGQHCYYYNCSGIGGTAPSLRKYASYADWVKDFDNLLEARYKGLPPEKFIGLYVQPGSPNWLFGVKQVLREFGELGIA
jgi:hypothetical protein